MEAVDIINGKKINQSVKHQHLRGQLRKHQDRDSRLIEEENEKVVEELQQQMFNIQRDDVFQKRLDLESAKFKAYNTSYCKRSYTDKPIYIHSNSEMDIKKMELEKLTFSHGAYRDKKAVLYFSSGREPEVNIHNLNYRMLHEARSMGGERRLLKMANPNKLSNSAGSSPKELDQQIWSAYAHMKCRHNSLSERDQTRKKLMELEVEKEQLFCDTPVKGFLWNSMPSTTNLRKQIQTLESRKEKHIRGIMAYKNMKHPYKGELWKPENELRKAENEFRFLRETMENIRQEKQKALQTLSHLKESS